MIRYRTIAISMVKNEQDVIEPFIRHNLKYVDAMFVVENASVDGTRAILLELQREGLPVIIMDDPESAYTQSAKMTRLVRCLTSTVFPDYIIPLDADEFIRCHSRREFDLDLARIPSGGAGIVAWVTYVLTPEDVAAGMADLPRDIHHRRTVERPQFSKAILRADGRYLPDIMFTQGNHELVRSDGEPLERCSLSNISLAHFPVRSGDQLEAKAVVGWIAYLKKDADARSKDAGYQWTEAFDAVAESGKFDPYEVAERSLMYAQAPRLIDWDSDVVADPVGFSYTRRYEGSNNDSALSLVARSWERSVAAPWSFSEPLMGRIQEASNRVRSESTGDLPTTSFGDDWHLERPFVDVPPMRYLAEKYQPGSVLDVGCGLGAHLLVFEEFADSEVLGLDGFDVRAGLLDSSKFQSTDVSEPIDLERSFDLVLCLEVLEHIETSRESVVLDSIARHARDLILFSAADVNQPGHGHVNCRPIAYWLAAWAERGWEPVLFDSLAFRSLATFSWLRRNPLVLKRSGSAWMDGNAQFLTEIGAKTYHWYGQEPEIIDFALTQDPPATLYDDA